MNLIFAACICSLLFWGTAVDGEEEDLFRLRREYNQVAASIDTLVRLYGGKELEALASRTPGRDLVPDGFELVLLFWADDEAEIFVNGYRISDTRLTPVQVSIPSLYLQEKNVLRAHCWDTDRVESGFMAGLYLRDSRERLRQVLVTEEGKWWIEGALAEERFYTHPQPDIPGARVIWGSGLFGEIWLETRFDAGSLHQAARRRPERLSAALDLQERPMETHELVSRLVRLQERRQDLERELQRRRNDRGTPRYQGYLRGQLAFTLGRAGPLAEEQSIATSSRLHAWAESLPAAHRSLLLRERRELKGVDAAIPEQVFAGDGDGEEDRRADYQPPPERGPVQEGAVVLQVTPLQRLEQVGRRAPWGLAVAAAGLVLYLGAVGRQWWRLFSGKVWKI